jgi:hypothetical protein
MTSILRLTLLFVFTAFLFSLNACKQDPCKKVDCGFNGYCSEGKCICSVKYEGEFCEKEKDLCKDMQCQNNGRCESGVCRCTPGYEGKYCETLMSTKFLGHYLFKESCVRSTDTTYANYDIHITNNDSILTIIYINNLKSSGSRVKANLYGNIFEIPSQSFTSSLLISGSGKLLSSKLEIDYIIETSSPNPDRLFCKGSS